MKAETIAAQLATKFFAHLIIRQIGDVAEHACQPQAAPWPDAMLVIVATMKIGVGQNGLPRHVVERNILRREPGCCCNDQRAAHAFRKGNRPTQCLHATKAAADDACPGVDAEQVSELRLRAHPIDHRNHWEIRAPEFVCRGVDGGRPGRTMTTAKIVHPNNEEAIRIEWSSRADNVVPPTQAIRCVGISPGNVMIA